MGARKDFSDFMLSKKIDTVNPDSNSFGSAFYKAGMADEDKYIRDAAPLLENLRTANFPKVGDLAVWVDDENKPYHIANVVKESPLTVSTRNGEGENFTKEELFTSTNFHYSGPEHGERRIEFRIPLPLQKGLNQEVADNLKTKEDFYKMVDDRMSAPETSKNVMCNTWSAYTSGEYPTEEFADINGEIGKNLKVSETPEVGYIIAWESRETPGHYIHSGLVVNADPLIFSNRRESSWARRDGSSAVIPNDNLEDLTKFYEKAYPGTNQLDAKMKFLIPSRLQDIIDAEASK